jgi:hypothetical protein
MFALWASEGKWQCPLKFSENLEMHYAGWCGIALGHCVIHLSKHENGAHEGKESECDIFC